MDSSSAYPIDFSTYSNEQLEHSLASINREKFEENYAACSAEIQNRKDEGRWKFVDTEAESAKAKKTLKITRVLALIQSIGGVIGILHYIYQLGPLLIRGELPLITIAMALVLIALLGLTTWSGWRFWKDQSDWKGLWRTLLFLQIPSFSIGGLSYEFYSGFKAPLGLSGERFGLSTEIGTNAALLWGSESSVFHFTINLAAILTLILLTESTRHARET